MPFPANVDVVMLPPDMDQPLEPRLCPESAMVKLPELPGAPARAVPPVYWTSFPPTEKVIAPLLLTNIPEENVPDRMVPPVPVNEKIPLLKLADFTPPPKLWADPAMKSAENDQTTPFSAMTGGATTSTRVDPPYDVPANKRPWLPDVLLQVTVPGEPPKKLELRMTAACADPAEAAIAGATATAATALRRIDTLGIPFQTFRTAQCPGRRPAF